VVEVVVEVVVVEVEVVVFVVVEVEVVVFVVVEVEVVVFVVVEVVVSVVVDTHMTLKGDLQFWPIWPPLEQFTDLV